MDSFCFRGVKVFAQEACREKGDVAGAVFQRRQVHVDDIELGMDPPHYTIRTLDALQKREKGNSFTLVVGADNMPRFSGWRDYRRILLEYGVVVFPREGFHPLRERNALKAENPLYRIKVLRAPMVNISSTDIREGLARGEDMSDVLM